MKTDLPNKVLFHIYLKVDKHVSKKNRKVVAKNKYTGKSFIRTASDAKSELNYITLKLLQKIGMNFKPISEDISVAFKFYYKKNKNGKPTKKFLDMSNAYQGPEDCLQEAGVILDDKQIVNHDGSSRILDANETALEIIIKAIN